MVDSMEWFDEKEYVAFADFESQSIAPLRADYCAVRQSASARGLAFHIAGHELRHVRALCEKYGLARS